MGKKNKSKLKDENIETKNSKELGIQNKIQKKKSNKDKSTDSGVVCKKSKKTILNKDEAQSSPFTDVPQLENNATITSNKVPRKRESNKNKKIIFGEDDDEPREVSVNNNVSANKKKNMGNDEEEPKDEDIDKFCDELDEEDNKQYEDWIKLLEAKLGSNKRKT